MQLQEFGNWMPDVWGQVPFGEWSEHLRSVCGRLNPRPYRESETVAGGISIYDAAGMEVVQVAADVLAVKRDQRDIRLDCREHFFLLLQLEGTCGIEQLGQQSVLAPGECILVDSARPATLYFGGRFSNHLSVHLPRRMLLDERACEIEVSRRLVSGDPMSTMLRALVTKMLHTSASDHRAPQLRQLLLHATRSAFAAPPSAQPSVPSDRCGGRLELAQLLIDRHLTEASLSPHWLAQKLGVSLRTLQVDFASLGVTVTSFIRDRRLRLAHGRLAEMRRAPGADTIAEIAYSSGFNDISYFNRCFKKAFDCSPTDVARR